jgi:hypothetical protein
MGPTMIAHESDGIEGRKADGLQMTFRWSIEHLRENKSIRLSAASPTGFLGQNAGGRCAREEIAGVEATEGS